MMTMNYFSLIFLQWSALSKEEVENAYLKSDPQAKCVFKITIFLLSYGPGNQAL